jgi:hypothetical protein
MTQLVTDLPASEGRGARLQISVGKQIEEGARAMLISIPGTMRMDVVPSEDMIRMVVRSFRERALAFAPAGSPGSTEIQLHGSSELSVPPVGNFNARIAVGNREGPELARVQIGSIRHPDQGVVAFTAQAIVDAELLAELEGRS